MERARSSRLALSLSSGVTYVGCLEATFGSSRSLRVQQLHARRASIVSTSRFRSFFVGLSCTDRRQMIVG